MKQFEVILSYAKYLSLFYRNKALKDCYEEITFQGDHIRDWQKEAGYPYDVSVDDMFFSWEHDKYRDILTYRDVSFASKFTGTQSPIHHSTFMEALDDSMACFLATKKS